MILESGMELGTIVRRCLSAYRWQTPGQIVEVLRAARVTVERDDVELALLDAPGVVRQGGRYRRA